MQHQASVFLAGDSTVQTYGKEHAPQAGWGQYIADFFTDGIRFDNRAIGGRSSKTFIGEGRLQAILNEIREGDYLFVQMGHNDATKSRPERYTEPYADYKSYLKMYVDGARSRGAIPVLITPVGRLHYENGAFLNDFPDYCAAMKQLAAEEDVPLIDLMGRSLRYYASVGLEEAQTFFMLSVNGTDHTHFSEKGAKEIAGLVADEVANLPIDLSRFTV